MKILLTGATGFIGHQLVDELSHNNKLTILTRSPAKAHRQLGGQHQYLGNLSSLSELDCYDAVINLAGEPIVNKRWSAKQKQIICNSRWDITARLTQLIQASQTPPKVFISASAIGIYGEHDSSPIDETYPIQQVFDSGEEETFPVKVCQRWEQLALAASSEQTRVCIIRTGLVLGLSGGALAKMLLPYKLGLGGPIGNGRQGMSWIHQQDHINLVQFLLDNEQCHGIYNATAPNPVDNNTFSARLGHALSRPAFMPMPAIALKLIMGEMSQLITEGQFVLPNRALKAGFNFTYTELDKALADVFAVR